MAAPSVQSQLASGVLPAVTDPLPTQRSWATDDGLVYFGGMSLRSVPASGGPIELVARMRPSFVDQPAFDGQYLYGSEDPMGWPSSGSPAEGPPRPPVGDLYALSATR